MYQALPVYLNIMPWELSLKSRTDNGAEVYFAEEVYLYQFIKHLLLFPVEYEMQELITGTEVNKKIYLSNQGNYLYFLFKKY